MIVPGSANALMLGQSSATGYNLTKSLRTRASASAYLNRTPSSATNRKTWTWSGWVKRGTLGSSGRQAIFSTASGASDATWLEFGWNGSGTDQFYITTYSVATTTTAVYRDPAAWYHIVVAFDTTQATGANRIKIYVNNVLQANSGGFIPTLNGDYGVNNTQVHNIANQPSGSLYFDGYQTEVNFIDGQALTPSSFGENNATTGVWQPKRYTGTYGTNGFYLPFTDVATTSGSNAGLGKDFSGNGNYWNTNNISVTTGSTYDSMTDVPTLTSATTANYCVMNPLDSYSAGVSNGNLKFSDGTGSAYQSYSTMSNPNIASNNFYCEVTVDAGYVVGIAPETKSAAAGNTDRTGVLGYYSNGNKYNGTTGSSYGATFTAGDVIGVAMGSGQIEFFKNGTSQGVAFTGLTGGYKFATWAAGSAGNGVQFNFGQQPFTYTPPTGFKALNTYNLPDSTIVAGNKVMDATLYTGNGTSQSVANVASFKPDLVWLKQRNGGVSYNLLYDSVRGATKWLSSNATAAEGTIASSLTAFNSNGFSVSTDPSGSDTGWNASGGTNVGWQWQAGQGTTSSNTNGSITSTVSVNASAGFSVVTYTAQTSGTGTVGHGLGVAPAFIITKNRSGTVGWNVYHQSLGGTQYIILNSTNAAQTSNVIWNDTNPTSSVFSFGTGFANSGTYVAYCWSEIAGFSKFGSYTGNGSTDGPFVYLGFRPKFVMVKLTTATDYWTIIDTTRNPYNSSVYRLYPNDSLAEDALTTVDILSNGFKVRSAGATSWNASGGTLIYAAFAESPFKVSLAR